LVLLISKPRIKPFSWSFFTSSMTRLTYLGCILLVLACTRATLSHMPGNLMDLSSGEI
jgi:hypothetical protein